MLNIFIQIVFILFLLVWAAFFTVQFFNILFRGYAPFIATRRKILAKIIKEVEMSQDATVYELGCGRAGFLHALRKKYPRAKLVGIEYAFLPYVLARVQNSFARGKLEVRKKNIFGVDLNKPDIIYCYLNPGTMLTLEKKFTNECKEGAVVISYQFPLLNLKPDKVVRIDNGKNRVYFYKMGKK